MATKNISELLDSYPKNSKFHKISTVKSDGGKRTIYVPSDDLKIWLSEVYKAMTKQYNSWPEFMHGGIKHRSYITYARDHINKPMVITLDIRKCFDSIMTPEVKIILQKHLSYSEDTSARLANYLCPDGKVAQGFPTSNYICNLFLLDPLVKLFENLRLEKIHLTNYVDDIAVSGKITKPNEVINQIATALSRTKLSMNKAKVTVMPSSDKQIICGLLVNKKLTITKDKKRQLLSDIKNKRISQTSLNGWISNLNSIDNKFKYKLLTYGKINKIL